MLLLVPVLCALAALAVYGGLRLMGVFPTISGLEPEPGPRSFAPPGRPSGQRSSSGASGLWGRAEEIPRGWLMAVIVVSAVWIVGWLVVLAVGLHLLT